MSKHVVEIFKVQVPIASNDPDPKALVYNRYRTKEGMVPIQPGLLDIMQGRLKIFIYASFHNGELDFRREAPWQEW